MNLKYALGGFWSVYKTEGLSGVWNTLADRICLRWLEWRFGIHSEAFLRLSELGHDKTHHDYVPTNYRSFLTVLGVLNIQPDRECFLDFGAGMGRVVILAATRPFRKVIGIEIVPQLSETARQNIDKALPRLKCRDIEIITSDATLFPVPDDVTVIYFFNPFRDEVLDKVMDNIHASLQRCPRVLRLVCKDPQLEVVGIEPQIRKHKWLRQERKMVFGANSQYLVFTASIESI